MMCLVGRVYTGYGHSVSTVGPGGYDRESVGTLLSDLWVFETWIRVTGSEGGSGPTGTHGSDDGDRESGTVCVVDPDFGPNLGRGVSVVPLSGRPWRGPDPGQRAWEVAGRTRWEFHADEDSAEGVTSLWARRSLV